jgi:putative ABC transport system permease protein
VREVFYRVLLHAYPRDFRLRYGDEMEAAFAACAERERGRALAALRIAVRALLDTASHGWRMRVDERRAHRLGTSSWNAARAARSTLMNGLDLKLAARMLVKYPGLTVVGGLAMAFAIWVGVVTFAMVTPFVYPSLPLPAAERVIKIENWDTATNNEDSRILHDFGIWRDSLRSITEIGVWRDSPRNVMIDDGDPRQVYAAEISASGFRVASAAPLLGRVLVDADEQPQAPWVAVIGYDLWQTRFGSDPNVLGREVKIGTDVATIVGVMRDGFAFPVAHEFWLPFRRDLVEQAPRSGPAASTFGLLASGETLETAQAELGAIGRRAAAESPATHEYLEPRVSTYADTMSGAEELGIMFSIYFFVVLLLILVCGNVGLLLFARAAARESDFLVRTALGASRARLVWQIFAEALVLGGLAALVGLIFADIALRNWGTTFLEGNLGRLPFWFALRLTPAAVLVAIALAVIGATVAGVMPALKLTRGLNDRLKQTTAAAGGLRFGGVWTAIIVAQVALTVAFPPVVFWEQGQLRHVQDFDPGFAAAQYLSVCIEREFPVDAGAGADPLTAERGKRFALALEELRRQVADQPGVAGVTLAERLPTTNQSRARIELASDAAEAAVGETAPVRRPLRVVAVAAVHPSYFDVLEAPVLAGRGFTLADSQPGARVAIVDQGFVDQVLQGRNPIGQQVRFARRPNSDSAAPPWYEVVGVVNDLGAGSPLDKGRAAGYYIPGTPDSYDEVYMMVHVQAGDPMTFASRLRDVARAVDPSLRLVDFQRANEVNAVMVSIIGLWLRVTLIMTGVAFVLSLAGIYAVSSFAVSRRTREIGLRLALGASPYRVVVAIFRRPLAQMGLGIAAGTLVILTFSALLPHTQFPGSETGLTVARTAMFLFYSTIMLGLCLVACVVPTRRALKVEPTVALRME